MIVIFYSNKIYHKEKCIDVDILLNLKSYVSLNT